MMIDLGNRIVNGFAYLVIVFVLCVTIYFIAQRLFSLSSEWSRKLLHFTAIAGLTTWLYVFGDWKTACLTMTIFMVTFCLGLYLAEKTPLFAFLSRVTSERKPGELINSLFAASMMFILVVSICGGFFGERNLALASIYAWGPGDAAAALVGKRYGKTKIGKQKKKSLEGSLSMFAASWVCVFVILMAGRSFAFLPSLLISLLTAIVTAYVELMVTSGYDTIFCPCAAMTVLCLSYMLQNLLTM